MLIGGLWTFSCSNKLSCDQCYYGIEEPNFIVILPSNQTGLAHKNRCKAGRNLCRLVLKDKRHNQYYRLYETHSSSGWTAHPRRYHTHSGALPCLGYVPSLVIFRAYCGTAGWYVYFPRLMGCISGPTLSKSLPAPGNLPLVNRPRMLTFIKALQLHVHVL